MREIKVAIDINRLVGEEGQAYFVGIASARWAALTHFTNSEVPDTLAGGSYCFY